MVFAAHGEIGLECLHVRHAEANVIHARCSIPAPLNDEIFHGRPLPIYPLFARGFTRLQPAYVEDVAEAVARALQRTEMYAITFECGGPRVYTYEELLRTIAREAKLKSMLIPIPFAAWHALAWFAEMLPSPPITRNQVELMQVDNVSSPEMPGFGELGISPHSIEEILQEILWEH